MKNNGGPAFPIPATEYHGMDAGASLRDYFAAKAMQGIVAHGDTWGIPSSDGIADTAYRIADAMLRAREAT